MLWHDMILWCVMDINDTVLPFPVHPPALPLTLNKSISKLKNANKLNACCTVPENRVAAILPMTDKCCIDNTNVTNTGNFCSERKATPAPSKEMMMRAAMITPAK